MQRTEFSTTTQQAIAGDFTLQLLDGAPGGGKSTTILKGALALNAPQIIAVPRIDLLQQHVARLREMSLGETEPPVIVEIHSRQRGTQGKVERRLRDALGAATNPRTLILTTHAALMGQEPQAIEGWHIRWDELPEADLVSGKVGLGASWPALAAPT